MSDLVFQEPTKQIKNVADLATWKKSQAYSDYMGFVRLMNTTVKGKKLTDECNVSETCQKLITMIDTLDGWAEEIPPLQQPQRYGNQAFRTWHTKLKEKGSVTTPGLITGLASRGTTRTFLCCLFKLRVLEETDSEAVVHRVFDRYLEFMRKLQTKYMMEPAGSQGVWGLDDFQFLPYIWGSSQLLGHPKVSPKDFVEQDVSHFYKDEYMFMACIEYINQVKTGPFAEHSNQLWNISGVMHWTKVNSGLIKMYMEEVLGKFPVVQHFHFGNLMSMKPA
ncbi:putative serine/threonine-protein phosphatase 2A activator-like [Apostichopus japonicus]|uniref:Serine/threonine-protein phosphatase 2A activator n=1 Tax=Stichopus japonicus TaxID=307972 RepID=A0A2G8LCA1_STIJA|nr:putative serine/threonine-protein phosphatase 2A activator-like [Apostichopus japonicus]